MSFRETVPFEPNAFTCSLLDPHPLCWYVEMLNCLLVWAASWTVCLRSGWWHYLLKQSGRILSASWQNSVSSGWTSICWFLHCSNNFRRKWQPYLDWPNNRLLAPKTWCSELQRLPTTQNKYLTTLSKKEKNFYALLINSMCSKQDGHLSEA